MWRDAVLDVFWASSADYGYCCGNIYVTSVHFSIIDRITFPFDSGTSSHVGNLNGNRNTLSGCNGSNYGYSMGGYDGTNHHSTIDRITFPFDSGTVSHVGNLSVDKVHSSASNNSPFYGYNMCNWDGQYANSTIDRITFPFDSGTVVHVGNLSGTRDLAVGIDGTDFVTLFV